MFGVWGSNDVGGTAVVASSTTQHCATLSTGEAECVAMAQSANTALFTGAVLAFLQQQLSGRKIDLLEDNQDSIAMAENLISGGRTKHIDVRYHFIRYLVKRKVIGIKYTESRDQHAGILTKPVGVKGFVRHRRFLMNCLVDFSCRCLVLPKASKILFSRPCTCAGRISM